MGDSDNAFMDLPFVRTVIPSLFVALAMASIGVAVSSANGAEAVTSDWASLTAELANAEYRQRQAAMQKLVDAGEPAFDAVQKAAQRSDEAGIRAVQILEEWAFGSQGAFPTRCEKLLMQLQETAEPATSSLACETLSVARDSRQLQAYDALVKMNAGVRFFGDLDEDYEDLSHDHRDVVHDKLRPISLVTIYPEWTGGEDGLWQLQRLQHQAGLQVRVATKVVPDAAITKATSILESVNVELRGPSLGLQAETGSPLRVKQVFPNMPAARAGLQYGDVILTFDGKAVNNISDLITLLRDYSSGDTKTLKFQRAYFSERLYGRGIDPDNVEKATPVEGEPNTYEVQVTLQGWESMPAPENLFRMMRQQRQFMPQFRRPMPQPAFPVPNQKGR